MPKSIDQCDAKNDSMSHYGAVSCHDWACRCSHPATVQRHSLCDDAVPASVKPNAYKRGFVLPGGSYLTKHNQLILPETKPPIKTRDPLKSNMSTAQCNELKETTNISVKYEYTSPVWNVACRGYKFPIDEID
ncbi:hypothetical protein CAPTEDRAFT_212559 [Capitella teleta]|uniref:Uncharacterized protein n=1 Tax=Capitella teleta TaxID=283909 RepID=R7UTR1_CAPTE|nr:hypothetical protein CAPTEDRAFT_212559 [Capitella teleta]|eukprot:ELU09545.1 hypothetical protein CAPTEDRAFT_212559 [Capitella teleta]